MDKEEQKFRYLWEVSFRNKGVYNVNTYYFIVGIDTLSYVLIYSCAKVFA